MRARDCIVVMARQPAPGSTKTRLAAALGDGIAASLYEAFLLDTLVTCGTVDAALLIAHAPDGAAAKRYFRRIAPTAVLSAQRDGGLGARLAAGMEAAFVRGYQRVAVIGSDIPHMASAWIEDAFASLDDHDVALGPTRDGGYYLLALRAPEPRLFEGISWSSGRELAQTLNRAGELGLRVNAIQRTFDIDDIDDLRSLQELVAARGAAACRRAAAALRLVDVDAFAPGEAVAR